MSTDDCDCPTGTFPYTVRQGDTFFLLAQRFGTSVAAIQAANPNVDPQNLRPGMTLCIPQTRTCGTGTTRYIAQQGDTFFLLAQRFNTTVAAIQAANPNVPPNNIIPGEVLCIPGQAGACPTGTFPYTVQQGDTFFLLAQRFGTSVAAIQAANPNVDPQNLRPGMTLCIPQTRTCGTGTTRYIAQQGDTFFLLAQRFNTTVAAIQAANPNVPPNNIIPGEVLCIPSGQPSQCPAGTFPYTIQQGDTFFLLAQRFGTTVAAIEAANPGVDPYNLIPGMVICIPGGGQPPSQCPAGTFPYTIRQGDTFFLLAQRFGTTVAAIEAANPGVDPYNLQPGMVICIPGSGQPPSQCPAGTFPYTIRQGDTFFRLAQRFGTTVAAIRRANPNVDPYNLQPGMVICIPGSGTPPPGGGSPCPSGTFAYVIQQGDTFFLLAQRFGTTVAAIRRANPNVDPYNLIPGRTICIPRN